VWGGEEGHGSAEAGILECTMRSHSSSSHLHSPKSAVGAAGHVFEDQGQDVHVCVCVHVCAHRYC
jgi:hypothetical protein